MAFIKLDRKMLKWEWKDDPNMVAIWIEILLQANWEDRNWHGENYEKGSFPTSIRSLAKSTGLSVQQVRTCLKKLESTAEITQQSTQHGTKIIVNKWEQYQGLDDDTNTPSNTRSTHDQHTINTAIRNKEYKERKNIYNTLPKYDPSKNVVMSEAEENEILQIMKGKHETDNIF